MDTSSSRIVKFHNFIDFVLGYKEIDNVSQIKQPTNDEILNESPSEYNFRHYTEV